jgi:hypothetical protein
VQCFIPRLGGVYYGEPQWFFVFRDAELLSIVPRSGTRADLLDVLNDDCKENSDYDGYSQQWQRKSSLAYTGLL